MTETRKFRVRRWLWLALLTLGLHSGCGSSDEDFGPTRTFAPPSGKKEPTAATPTSAANPSSNDAAPKTESVASSPAADSTTAAVQPASATEASSPRRSREDDDPPAQVAKVSDKPAVTDSPSKVANESKEPTDKSETPKPTDPAAESETVVHQPLSPELREWLLVKRRQAGSSDGLSVLTASDLSNVSWHDLRTGHQTLEFFGKSGQTTGLLLAPTRRWVLGASDAGWLRLWTIESSAGLDRFAREARREAQGAISGIDTEQQGVWALAADRQGKWFLTGGEDGSLRVCAIESDSPAEAEKPNTPTLAIKLGAKFPAHQGTVTDLEISANDAWVVSGGTDHRVCLWDAKSGSAVRAWTDSPAPITDVGLSADGRIVAASCLDKFVRWWSADAPEPTAAEKDKPSEKAAPKTVAAAGTKTAPKETKPKNGLEHPDLVLSVAVSADGQFVATGGKDRIVRVWELATGQIVEKHSEAKDTVVEVRFVDGDKRLFIRDRSGAARSKPRAKRNEDEDAIPQESERPFQFVTPSALLNANPTSIAAAADTDSELAQQQNALRTASSRKARETAREALVKTLRPEAADDIAKAEQVAALEKQLASAASDTIKADLKKQLSRLKAVPVSQERTERPKLLGTLTTSFQFGSGSRNPSSSRAVQLAIHGDGELVTATTSPIVPDADDDRRRPAENTTSQLWAWDIATQSLLRHWDDARSSLGSCEFADSTNQFVTASGHVFELPTGESRALGEQTLDQFSAIATSPDGRLVAVGYAGAAQATGSVLRLFESATLKELKSYEAFEGLTTAITFSPDGTSLAVAIRERQLHRLLVFDAINLSLLATVEEQPHSAPWLQGLHGESRDRGLTALRFSTDGRYLLTHGSYGSNDYRLTLWQKKGAKWTKETGINSKANQAIIDDVQPPAPFWFIGGRGSQMAAITAKGLGIVDTSNGRLLRTVELKSGLKDRHPVAWSADGNWLAQGDETGQITLWNLRTDKEAAIFPAQLGPLKALALSHDGRVLATLGEENKLHLWNLENWQPKNRVAPKPKTAKPATTD